MKAKKQFLTFEVNRFRNTFTDSIYKCKKKSAKEDTSIPRLPSILFQFKFSTCSKPTLLASVTSAFSLSGRKLEIPMPR